MNNTMKAIAEYKAQACAMVNGHCENCEAHYIFENEQYCCFNTVKGVIELVSTEPTPTNAICTKEDDHVWRWIGSSTGGTLFRCQKCAAIKTGWEMLLRMHT